MEEKWYIKQLSKIRQGVILCGYHSWDNEPQIHNKTTRISSAFFCHIFWYTINFESGSIMDIYIPGSQPPALKLIPWKLAWSIFSLRIIWRTTRITVPFMIFWETTIFQEMALYRKIHYKIQHNSERQNYMLRQHLIVCNNPLIFSSLFLAHILRIWEWLQLRGAFED